MKLVELRIIRTYCLIPVIVVHYSLIVKEKESSLRLIYFQSRKINYRDILHVMISQQANALIFQRLVNKIFFFSTKIVNLRKPGLNLKKLLGAYLDA